MQKKVLFAVLASIGLGVMVGCGSDDPKPTSSAEKKAFSGGPMPADARAKFEESQKKEQALLADRVAKGKASATTGK